MADDKIVCPECGAPGVTGSDDRIYCQGPSAITTDMVSDAEKALKMASARGDVTDALDLQWRTLSAQRICGGKFYKDGDVWRRVVPGPGQ